MKMKFSPEKIHYKFSQEGLNIPNMWIPQPWHRHFNFNNHNTAVCRQSSQKVGVLLRLRKLIPVSAKLQLYKSAILPHLTYCHLVWHFCRASGKRKLERIQERALRAVFNTNSLTYQELLDKAQLSSLNNRRLQNIAILMYIKLKTT